VPARDAWDHRGDAAYLHYTPNETIGGVELHDVPDVGDTPLVADMSSNILSRPVDVERYGLIYAGGQKNVGIAGLVIVIVREDLVGRASASIPEMLDYKVHADSGSLSCTAPTFAWYMADRVFDWLAEQGGVAAMGEVNQRKAGALYDFTDGSNFYNNPVAVEHRSRMNVPFKLADARLDEAFLEESKAVGLVGLKGHRFVGGMRASIYNAMPEEGVSALLDFMRDFVDRRG
jgi:phosphoserine aminotransferase